ncbi:MAG TPA: lipoyl synthase [Thermoleophilia bacterium]|nr:lipoyl synthase [Thermoleophilia bacterium]
MGAPPTSRKPAWLRVAAPLPRQFRATGALLDELRVNTICREARCPNKSECYSAGTASFLILGDTCTRSCRFCSVSARGDTASMKPRADPAISAPRAIDEDEPRRVAAAVTRLGLRHVVITSVTRDDLPDGGASHFATTIHAVRRSAPGVTVEVLIPDLGGDHEALRAVFAACPDVLDHNLETVPSLYPKARPQASYGRSLELLTRAAAWARGPVARRPFSTTPARRPLVKTSLMVGLGERDDELDQVIADCVAARVDLVTVGQYLQPRPDCLPVVRYVDPAELKAKEESWRAMCIRVRAAPFMRSSYRAGEALSL